MSKLTAFLHPETVGEKDVFISKRFKDEDGNPVLFRIRPISQEENEALIKRYTVKVKDRAGNEKKTLDTERYSRALIVAGTVEPDFKSSELCEAYGVLDPLQVAPKMLLVGEYQKLSDAISELSGLSEDEEEIAKN